MPFRDDYWPPPAPPIEVSGGLKTRKARGAIGETWWSRRFIDVLESFGMENRLARGRTYARKGQVVSLDVHTGIAHAIVQGSRVRPYRVTIAVDELSDDDWQRVGDAFAARAVFLAKLLAGEMPQNIEEAFAACKLSLLPSQADELDTTCSCPDIANPCKHIAAALYLLAESFDEDPFRIFEWRGRSQEELLAVLSMRVRGASVMPDVAVADAMWERLASVPPLSECVADFWTGSAEPSPAVVASLYPDVLLRQMDPFPETLGDHTLVDLLSPVLTSIATTAAEVQKP
jgi:uncharacterized Zn finger protein